MRQERKTGEALEDSLDNESRLRLIIDTTRALIYTARPDGYIDFFNQQCLKFLGLSFEEISGWGWTRTIHSDDIEALLAKWRAAIGTGDPFVHESRVRRADCKYRLMLHHNVALLDDQGKIVRWFGSSTDIDDQKRAEHRSAHDFRRKPTTRITASREPTSTFVASAKFSDRNLQF